ncbi:MAG: chromosomal replication initiator protein DnaA [Cytophagaceae bacterium]|jgi:chromosomal replication initiator protein|nr:chromosomal replication initiator protein DnaA [Cytophagaceae bacterium]
MEPKYQKVWEKCLETFEMSLDKVTFQTWFEPIVPLKLAGSVLTIQVPSLFFYEMIEERFIDLVSRGLRENIGPAAKLEYSVIMDKTATPKPYTMNLGTGNKSAVSEKHPQFGKTPNKKINVTPQLNPDYTFENFVEGECNHLARAVGLQIAEKPGETAFNPLFVFGNSGLGKTHLAQAIGVEAKKKYPEKNVLYVTANTFATQFSEASIANTRNDFLNFYQMMDVLIIDDIQEFAGKKGTQNTFFHIFNDLHQRKKQLVLTSDQPPAELQGMEERLLSRFKWGLPVELNMPDYETKVKILKHKMKKDGIIVPDEVVHYLATSIKHNIRELESALISLLALSTLNKSEITLKTAENIVSKLIKETHREISVGYIQKTVCSYFGLEPDILLSKSRKREIVQARQIAMYFSKNLTSSSLSTIGTIIGKKDHATVLHACKTITNLLETDKELKSQIKAIEVELMK